MQNRKGFTLIELLAVIVILAILMVAAGAAVISTMNNAKVNTFKDEALQMIDSAKQMYTNESMTSNSEYVKTDGNSKIMCVKLDTLKSQGYLEKDLTGQGYSGYVVVMAPLTSADVQYYVSVSNGTYSLENVEKNKISSKKIDDMGTSSTITYTGTTSLNGHTINLAECK